VLSATLEHRGLGDVAENLAAADSAALFRFFQRRGVLDGNPGPLPALRCEATPLAGVAMVRAAGSGLVDFKAAPGERVRAGQTVAVLIDPLAADRGERRREVATPVAGVLFARARRRLARPGDILVKVAGAEPLPGRKGHLLSD
jgi:uncharacterized protein